MISSFLSRCINAHHGVGNSMRRLVDLTDGRKRRRIDKPRQGPPRGPLGQGPGSIPFKTSGLRLVLSGRRRHLGRTFRDRESRDWTALHLSVESTRRAERRSWVGGVLGSTGTAVTRHAATAPRCGSGQVAPHRGHPRNKRFLGLQGRPEALSGGQNYVFPEGTWMMVRAKHIRSQSG